MCGLSKVHVRTLLFGFDDLGESVLWGSQMHSDHMGQEVAIMNREIGNGQQRSDKRPLAVQLLRVLWARFHQCREVSDTVG